MNKSFLFSIFFLFLFLSFTASISACTCNCNYIPGATCGGLAGTSGCSFTTDEINQVRDYAQNNPGKAYTGMCTYSYSVGYSCYYTFSIHETVTWDGCGCDLGSGSSCGRLEDCSVCKNPTFRYSSSSCGITNTPTNTPIVTPTFTKTPTPTPTLIVTPTCNPNFTLNAVPVCNKENFSITNYPEANKPISNSVKKDGGSEDAFPGCDFTNVHSSGASCDLTEIVSFDWTHSYQTCTTPTNCSQTCTKTIQKLNDVPVTPTCPPTVEGSCWADPQPVHFDSNINFLGNYPGQPEQFNNISVSSDGYACGTASTSFFNGKTTITSACGTPIPNASNYDLGLSFNYSIPACPGLLSNTCSCNVSADPSIYPGFLQTENGDMYAKGGSPDEPSIKMSNYPTSKSLSKFTFGNPKGFIRINGANQACDTGSTFGICSTQRYILWGYTDSNTPGNDGSYFASLVSIIENNIANDDTITQNTITYPNIVYDDFDERFNFDVIRLTDEESGMQINGGDGFLLPYYVHPNFKIKRVNYNGYYDFNPDTSATNIFNVGIYSVAKQGQRYLVGGAFNDAPSIKNYLARMEYNDDHILEIDNDFNVGGTGPNGRVTKILVDSDERIYIAADSTGFTSYNGISAKERLVRLNPNGTRDNSFVLQTSGSSSWVRDFDIDEKNRIILVGSLNNATPKARGILRTDINGNIDETFLTGEGFNIPPAVVEPIKDGYLVFGLFTTFNGSSVQKLIKIKEDGSLDTSFSFPYSRFDFEHGVIRNIKVIKDKVVLMGELIFDFNSNGEYKRFPYLFFDFNGNFEPSYMDPYYLSHDGLLLSNVFVRVNSENFLISDGSYIKRINSRGIIDPIYSSNSMSASVYYSQDNTVVPDPAVTYHCTRDSIFLIEGDLTLYPDFVNDGDSACMFIVKGTTYIRENGDQEDNQDIVDAFIITTNFVSDKEHSDDQLIINGGLIIGNNANFLRNINYNSTLTLHPYTPSELIKYEGARYISKFNKILKVPTTLTIKETN